jgi:hypothetical protein
MASYLLDVICARNTFAKMNLNWHPSELAVHVYYNILWETKYNKFYVVICDQFIVPIYLFLFNKECPRLSGEAKKVIVKIGHWYLDERETYIRIFGAIGAPHLLPIYVPDRLLLGEICYQTIIQGYNATLVKDNKRAFIPYGFHIGFCMVKDTTHAKKIGLGQLEFWFQTNQFCKHDPKGLVIQHASQVSSCWPYAHDQFEDEIFTEKAQDWDMVTTRKVDPRGTRFRAMSFEKQAMFLEQSVQGVGRRPEAAIAYELEEETNDPQEDIEITEAHQLSPVQIRDLPEDQMAQESGSLLYQQTQLLMKQMSDNPHLSISPRISNTIQIIPTEPSDPSLIVTDGTNGSGNPKSMIFPIDPSGEGTTQPETGRVSIETQAPNPLIMLIHIYNGDESTKPSRGTPMHVQEEEGPENTPSPSLEKVSSTGLRVQDQGVPHKEAEAKGNINTGKSDESEIDVFPSDDPP